MRHKKSWIFIGVGVVILFFFIFLSNIIEVGQKLRDIHEYVEYGFYALAVILVYVLLVNPIRIILFAPTFSVDAMLDDSKKYKIYKSAAKVLIENEKLPEEDITLLKSSLGNKEELKQSLTKVFDTTIKKEINQLIINNSKTVMVSTALSQNGNLDMLSVIAINLKMIKEIVQMSGFRPSYPYLGKLSVNVLATSLVAEGIDDIDISELLPNKVSETLTDIPFLKTFSNSVMSGIANAVLTCRVGIITRNYLFNDNKLLTRKEIRRMAYKEAVKMMPIIVKDGLAVFPKGIGKVFSAPFKRKTKKETE